MKRALELFQLDIELYLDPFPVRAVSFVLCSCEMQRNVTKSQISKYKIFEVQ